MDWKGLAVKTDLIFHSTENGSERKSAQFRAETRAGAATIKAERKINTASTGASPAQVRAQHRCSAEPSSSLKGRKGGRAEVMRMKTD